MVLTTAKAAAAASSVTARILVFFAHRTAPKLRKSGSPFAAIDTAAGAGDGAATFDFLRSNMLTPNAHTHCAVWITTYYGFFRVNFFRPYARG